MLTGWVRPCLWACTAYAVLTAFSLSIVHWYGEGILPFYRWELSKIAPGYTVQTITFDQSGIDPVFKVRARHMIKFERYAMLYEIKGDTWALAGIQHLVLVLFIPLAWPRLKLRQRLLGLLIAIPVLIALEWADTPWTIVAGLDYGRASIAGGSTTEAAAWSNILNSGGRLGLSLVGGLFALGGGYFVDRLLTEYRNISKHSKAIHR